MLYSILSEKTPHIRLTSTYMNRCWISWYSSWVKDTIIACFS